MTVLCLGYFDKFSRFFLDIKKNLQNGSSQPLDFKVYSIHFSGFLYTLLRLKFSSWIALKARFLVRRKKASYIGIINETKLYKNLPYNDYTKFHLGLNQYISKLALQLQALAYIDIFDSIFTKSKPNYLICVGDSRMSIEIAVALAKQNDIKVYFIEQGPFNTTFFDESGVNANLSIRKLNELGTSKTYSDSGFDLNHNTTKYKRSPIYRGFDMLLIALFKRSKFYPPDLKFADINTSTLKTTKATNPLINYNTNHKIVLLVLQVPLDVNMIYHSPFFKSHTEIIKSIYSNLPENVELIIREHPLFIDKYEKSFYDFSIENEIKIDNLTSLNIAIESSDVIIVNNSTVGVEAILNYKPVVVLGNSFYDWTNICLKLKNKDEVALLLEKALSYSPNIKSIDNFKNLLFSTALLKGSITDKDLKSSQYIANHILDHR
ncbi:hypothetical protein [Winogradskyella sp. PG-2]|uniref:capsular polysaccharide export protein, LipB/KpsS family n=1 Tax=Winogradskyella sp. PG-2 TaxID=754409 RepID=UPI0004588B9B|nr:hypothetical protein [Winogradskyella sp. PG-2]BAO76640.1 capsular polysaccharide export system protein KpsS [Winogradskyella sp. PG-2]